MLAFLDARVHPNFDKWRWSACFKAVKRRNFPNKNGYHNNKSIKQHKRHRICNVIIILFLVRSQCKFGPNTSRSPLRLWPHSAQTAQSALHALHTTQSSHEKAVRLPVLPSVCPSVKQKKVLPLEFYTIWMIIYMVDSFLRRMVGGRRTFLPESLGQTGPVGAKIADFQSIFLCSVLAGRPSQKKFN